MFKKFTKRFILIHTLKLFRIHIFIAMKLICKNLFLLIICEEYLFLQDFINICNENK